MRTLLLLVLAVGASLALANQLINEKVPWKHLCCAILLKQFDSSQHEIFTCVLYLTHILIDPVDKNLIVRVLQIMAICYEEGGEMSIE